MNITAKLNVISKDVLGSGHLW